MKTRQLDLRQRLKTDIISLAIQALNVGFNGGVIGKEEYVQSLKEIRDIDNFSDDELDMFFDLLLKEWGVEHEPVASV